MSNEIVDMLYRDEDIKNIIEKIELVKDNENNSFIMIDGEWGSGKTTLMNMIYDRIKDDYNIVKYNCWENSFYEDPLIAIISSVTDQMMEFKDINKAGLNIIQKFGLTEETKKIFKVSFFGIEFVINKNDKNDNYKSLESYINEFKSELINFNRQNYGKDNKKTRIIIVDELDRCLPEYAIKILERLYLLFKGVDNIIVLIANDKHKLRKSIEHIYGYNDNGDLVDEYLKKFIDDTYSINYNSIDKNKVYSNYKYYFERFGINENSEIIINISIVLNGLNPREINQKISRINKIHLSIFENENVDDYICLTELIISFVKTDIILKIVEGYDTVNGVILKDNLLYQQILFGYDKLDDRNYSPGMITPKDYFGKAVQLILSTLYRLNTNQKFIKSHYNFIVNYDNKELIDKINTFINLIK